MQTISNHSQTVAVSDVARLAASAVSTRLHMKQKAATVSGQVEVEASDNSLFLQTMRTALATTMTSFRCFLQPNAESYRKGTKHANLLSW